MSDRTSGLPGRWAITVVLWGLCALLGASTGSATETTPGQALSRALGCVECHGEHGVSANPATPNLAGQDRHYLTRQLRELSESHADVDFDTPNGADRADPSMGPRAASLSAADVEVLADYYSGLACPTGWVQSFDSPPSFGRECVRCHGPAGVNIEPAMPDLGGQNAAYLVKQLTAFRAAFFGNAELNPAKERFDPEMARHAIDLSDEQIRALADYFSALGCR